MKWLLKWLLKALLGLISAVAVYLLVALLLSAIPYKKEEPQEEADIPIYLLTNGVHSDIVLPVRHEAHDWSALLPYSHTQANDHTRDYIAFGWGDKGFYLETPTWGDLKASAAFKALFWLSTSAMHTTFYPALRENERCRKLMLTKAQYQRLVAFVMEGFQLGEDGKPQRIGTASYGKNDAFYEGSGRYSFLHTCNTWTNNALKACGQAACVWTPFDKGIFYHYPTK